jgi:hypothetical protein
VAAGVLLAIVLAGCGGGDGDDAGAGRTRAEQARQIARDAGLPRRIQDFFASAAGAVDRTYSVSYRLGEGSGSSTVVQDPPRRRIEFVVPSNGVPVNRVFITNADGTFGCTRTAGRWTCQRNADAPAAIGALSLGDVQEATQDLAEARGAYAFRIERRTIARTPAQCLVTELKPGQTADDARGQRGVLCISAEGVPLLIEGAQGTLTAVSYRPGAADAAFDLPARPQRTSTTAR